MYLYTIPRTIYRKIGWNRYTAKKQGQQSNSEIKEKTQICLKDTYMYHHAHQHTVLYFRHGRHVITHILHKQPLAWEGGCWEGCSPPCWPVWNTVDIELCLSNWSLIKKKIFLTAPLKCLWIHYSAVVQIWKYGKFEGYNYLRLPTSLSWQDCRSSPQKV